MGNHGLTLASWLWNAKYKKRSPWASFLLMPGDVEKLSQLINLYEE